MRKKYQRYYQSYSFLAPLHFCWDILKTKSSTEKLSLIYRLRDYIRVKKGGEELFKLHGAINNILLDSTNNWPHHDYGEGYFYQSCDEVYLSGLRNTTTRVNSMNLQKLCRNKFVIDIGCNSGFLDIALSRQAKQIIGFDVNPYLINIGDSIIKHLGCNNIKLLPTSFEKFESKEPADIILSLANHSTYDGNTKQTQESYLLKCRDLLKPGGFLLFESHHPYYESKSDLEKVCALINTLFTVIDRKIIKSKTFFDNNRTFIVAQKNIENE